MARSTRLASAGGRVSLLALIASAALGTAVADEGDPPGRAAQLSDVEGAVSLQPAGVADWVAATPNRPLTTGDRLWVDRNARAELDLGAAALRLGSGTGFSFLNLDDVTVQMQVTAGTLIAHVRDIQAGQLYEIDTPNVAISLQQPGEYRVEVSDAGDATIVKVSDGTAQVAGGAQTIAIGAQQQVLFTGTSTLNYDTEPLGPPDGLDNWSAAREREVEDASSSQYVADDMPGRQDLDNNGSWQETPDYGYVWVPTVVAIGWVPYRFGRWVWMTPWGWTWIDDARWGYAPFHYGRWTQWRNTWCWVPGPQRVRPVYAPALVAWVGGPSVSTSPAFGSSVGWFPLAPGEAYLPANRVSAAYLRNVNVTNTTIVNSLYLNQLYQSRVTPSHYANNRAAAVTTVPESLFVSGQPIGARALSLPAPVLAGALVTATAPAIAPTRQSVLGAAAGGGVAHPPAALARRTVLVHTPPPRAPAPFERQLAAIEANDGRPLALGELTHLQPAAAAVPVRMITVTAPVVAASSLPSHGMLGTPSLAEREHALENTTPLPPPPRAASPNAVRDTALPAPASAASPNTPPYRNDRPPWVQEAPRATPQHAPGSDDPGHAYSRAAGIPVYAPPGGADPGLPDTSLPAENHVARTTTKPHAAPPAQSTSHSSTTQSSKEPRDSAPHGDRDSRERVER